MARSYVLLVPLSIATAGCIGGQVTDRTTGQPVDGVRVEARTCPTCTSHVTTTQRELVNGESEMSGIWDFDPYEGEPNVTPSTEEAVQLTFSKAGYRTIVKYHRPQFEYYRHASGEDRAASIVRLQMSRSTEPDTDLDGLSDSYEAALGTNPNSRDTDGDGLEDGWEVYGHEWVDLPSYGASPKRKDVFVEIDYEYWSEGGVAHSARLSDAAIGKIEALYRGLNITNPDGSRGVAIHIVQDLTLPRGFNCEGALYQPLTGLSARRRPFFHHGQLCLAAGPTFQKGEARSARFRVNAFETNRELADDQTEEQQMTWALMVAHEIGHTYGLGHGGGNGTNCKPNYPSLMNYAYTKEFLGTPFTIRDSRLQFSPGRFVAFPLNETSLNEVSPFPGVPVDELAFLRNFGSPSSMFGFAVNASGGVDWNRNGFVTGTVAADINARGYIPLITGTEACASTSTSDIHRDFNDGELIANFLRTTGPGVSSTLALTSASSDPVCRF